MSILEVSETARVHMVLVSVAFVGGAIGGFVHWIATFLFWNDLRIADHDFVGSEMFALGLWGLLFCIPLHNHIGNFWVRAVLFAVPPAVFGPLIFADKGFFTLGWLTPIWSLLSFSLTWSIPAYLWVGLCGYAGRVDSSLTEAEGMHPDSQEFLP